MALTLAPADYRKRVMACWLGKAVGGTLGMPYEGVRHTLDLTYYDPVPTEMVPNDDLDLQVVHAVLLDRMASPRIDRRLLAKAWGHVGITADEYGIAKRNLALGLTPPATGAYDNPFTRGMGAAIRTELWACLAPGDPDAAARFACEDACMDHAGEGVHAAAFLAALQSLAFVESSREALLDRACRCIPGDCELAAAIGDTRRWWAECRDWRRVQRRLAERYLNDNFTDVVINLAYVVLGWLAGRDFGDAICIAVNCGQDTDCTGATLGALLGILDPDGIDERWLKPIGRDLVLSAYITGIDHPPTLDGFTDLVVSLRDRLDPATPPAPGPPEPPPDRLAIPATLGFLDALPPAAGPAPALPADARPVRFPGNWATLPPEACRGDVAIVQYTAAFAEPRDIQLMFSSPQPVRVWWDDRLVIDSPGGQFVPAPHRTRPRGCSHDLHADRGTHRITAAVARRSGGDALQWVVALLDTAAPRRVERLWLVDPLRPAFRER